MLFRYLTAALLLSAIPATPAAAQSAPIDAVGAYNHSQVMRHRGGTSDNREDAAPDPQKTGHDRLMALSAESRNALIALKPELDRRTRLHGAAEANRWFEGKVAEAEKREGLRD